jgi:uncharacterized protein YjbJ (UPF0337 family)
MKGNIKEKWGNLTDDDLTAINGKREQLEGKIQERYGIAKDQVRKDVDDWYDAQTNCARGRARICKVGRSGKWRPFPHDFSGIRAPPRRGAYRDRSYGMSECRRTSPGV